VVLAAGGGVPEGWVEDDEGCGGCVGEELVLGIRIWEGLVVSRQALSISKTCINLFALGLDRNVPQKLGWLKSTHGAAV
jgi:hypothetical protein